MSLSKVITKSVTVEVHTHTHYKHYTHANANAKWQWENEASKREKNEEKVEKKICDEDEHWTYCNCLSILY